MKRIEGGNLLIALKEMRLNHRVLIICLLITIGLTTITLSLCSVIQYLPESFIESIKVNALQIKIKDYSVKDIHKLSMPSANILVYNEEFLNEFVLERSNGQKQEINRNNQVIAIYFDEFDNTYHLYNLFLNSGRVWHPMDNAKINDRYGIWISSDLSNNKIKAGHILKYYKNDTDAPEELEVRGVYVKPSSIFPDIIVPVSFLADKISADDNSSEISVYITNENIYGVLRSYILKNLEIDDSSGLYSQIKGVMYMLALLWSVLFLIIFISLFIIYNLISMVIIYREKFIGLIKALGNSDRRILNIYSLIIRIMILFSVCLSIIAAAWLNDFIAATFMRNLDIQLNLKIILRFPLLIFVAYNIIFLIFRIFLRTRIRKIAAIEMIREEN